MSVWSEEGIGSMSQSLWEGFRLLRRLRESELIAGDSEYRYSTSSLRQASLQRSSRRAVESC